MRPIHTAISAAAVLAMSAGAHAAPPTISGHNVLQSPFGFPEATLFDQNGRPLGSIVDFEGEDDFVVWTTPESPTTLARGELVVPRGVNASGAVVGRIDDDTGNMAPFIWTSDDGLRLLPRPEGIGAAAIDINDAGTAVGSTREGMDNYPAVWRNGAFERLAYPGEDVGGQFPVYDARAERINETGMIVGTSNPRSDVIYTHPVAWLPDGAVRFLDIPADEPTTFIQGLNNAGVAVGQFYTAPSYEDRPFTWNIATGAMTELPLPPGYTSGGTQFIRDDGWIAGYAVAYEPMYQRTAVLWDPEGNVHDLNELYDTGLGPIISVRDIAPNGDILAVAEFGGSFPSSVVLHSDLVEEEGCPADRDQDRDADVQDLLSYLSDFRGGEADFDGDTDTDVQDLLGYLGAFRAGC